MSEWRCDGCEWNEKASRYAAGRCLYDLLELPSKRVCPYTLEQMVLDNERAQRVIAARKEKEAQE